jgi:hypothetical protein
MRSFRTPLRVRLSHPSQVLGQEAEQHIGPFRHQTLRSMRRAQMRIRGKKFSRPDNSGHAGRLEGGSFAAESSRYRDAAQPHHRDGDARTKCADLFGLRRPPAAVRAGYFSPLPTRLRFNPIAVTSNRAPPQPAPATQRGPRAEECVVSAIEKDLAMLSSNASKQEKLKAPRARPLPRRGPSTMWGTSSIMWGNVMSRTVGTPADRGVAP